MKTNEKIIRGLLKVIIASLSGVLIFTVIAAVANILNLCEQCN